uniref:Protein spaetzle-like n=1 Tax=Strongyloides stercoralis TaxID=6248 RepID=A0A0K0EQL7_STRER
MWSIYSILLFFSSFLVFINTENILNDKNNNTNNVYSLRPDLFIMDLVKQFLEKDFTTTIKPQSNVTSKLILNSINKENNVNNKTNNFDKDSILKIVDNSNEETSTNNVKKNIEINCEPSDEKFLYTKLENMGGVNQGFMANSIKEAALHFSELVNEKPLDNPVGKTRIIQDEVGQYNVQTASEDTVDAVHVPMLMSAPENLEASGEGNNNKEFITSNINDPLMVNDPNCDSRCQRLMKVLTEAVGSSNKSSYSTRIKRNNDDIETSFPDDDESTEEKIENLISKPTSYENIPCIPQQTIYVDESECIKRGKQLDSYGNLFSLCTACSVVYVMPNHCFPKFFNGVQCNSRDNKCIFNRNTQAVYGQCLGQTLSYKVLKNIKDDSCPQWREETIQLPIACSCALKMNSFITA